MPNNSKSKRVLIADDDRALSVLLSTRLKEKGWRVEVALDAMQALMFAMRTPPDVITLDINMPGGQGMDVLKKLKRASKTAAIPVVVLSGTNDAKAEATVTELGAAAFMRKPPDVDELNQLLLRLAEI